MASGEKFCRNPPIQSSVLSAPSTERSLFKPELPPVETAVMRAFVDPRAQGVPFRERDSHVGKASSCQRNGFEILGRDDGLVHGARRINRWVVIESVPSSVIVCCTACNFSLTVISRTELTATLTSARASANPFAVTVTR